MSTNECYYVNVVNVDVVDFCVVAEFSQPTSGNMTRAGATAGRAGRNQFSFRSEAKRSVRAPTLQPLKSAPMTFDPIKRKEPTFEP